MQQHLESKMSDDTMDETEVTLDEMTACEKVPDELSPAEVRVEGLNKLREPMEQGKSDGQDAEESSFVSCSNNRSVQVAVRVRPLQKDEPEAGFETLFDKKNLTQHAQDKRRRKHPTILRVGDNQTFCYDEVFPQETVQKDIYQHRVAPLVNRCLEGYNATILAYGQTGAGKTYTMTGPPGSTKDLSEDQLGVIPRALRDLFKGLDEKKKEQEGRSGYKSLVKSSYKVEVQFLELYMDDVRDLLQNPKEKSRKVQIRAIGNQEPEVLGSVKATVKTAEAALELLAKGLERRVTGATSMNASSSRSHAIFSVMIEQKTSMTGAVSKGSHVKKSQFHLCDLAGSERHKRVMLEKQSEKHKKLMQGEVCQINMGLLALGNVISALGDPRRSTNGFVPYRDSKLTLLLKGSLGGNHHTLMIACVSPAKSNKDESVNTLRYANRAKNITNHVVVNLDRRSQLLDQLQSQVQSLANDLLVAYEQDNTGGIAFRSLLQKIAAGDKDRKLEQQEGAATGMDTSSEAIQSPLKTPTSPSLSTTANGDPRPSRHVSMIPRFNDKSKLKPLAAKTTPEYLVPTTISVTTDEVPSKLAETEEEITNLREELKEAKEELVLALATERNPPDDGSLSDLSEASFNSRIETVESFDSNDSAEIRVLRRKLCKRLENLKDDGEAEEYGNIMKQHYEKVQHMSLALQQKEDTRATLVKRMHGEPEEIKEKELDRPLVSKQPMSMPTVYAAAAVYCSVLFCIGSIILKV